MPRRAQQLLLSMLAGPLYALSIFSKPSAHSTLCKLTCAGAPGMHWVVPCFVARHNARTRSDTCAVTVLHK